MLGLAAPVWAGARDSGKDPARPAGPLGGARPVAGVSANRGADPLDDPYYSDTIDRVSAREGVDPQLVRALIHVESAYQPNARSPKGAMGLMQLMPGTARQYGVANAYDPITNIEAGVRHLRSLLERFPVDLAIAAYNAGEAAVERFNGIPPFRETQDYVARVLQSIGGAGNYRARGYRLAGGGRTSPPATRRFAFSGAAQGGLSLPLRAARNPWRPGQPVADATTPVDHRLRVAQAR